jgi:beta-glucosidase
MEETYLPTFKKLVKAGVSGIMGAYNRTNGEVCCGSKTLLMEILRQEWDFGGYIVSDCWAISDFHEFHKVTNSPEESVALALKNGCNLNCGVTYKYLLSALEQGLINESDIDQSLAYVLRIRFRLGMFDDDYKELDQKYPTSLINCEKHRKLALEAARKSIVLLENNDALPLNKNEIRSIFVTGPMAARIEALIGNYYGVSARFTTILEGITECADEKIRIMYNPCCYPAGAWKSKPEGMLAACSYTDVTIGVFGLDVTLEGEQGEAFESLDGDRLKLTLPDVQMECIKELRKRTKDNNRKFILILTGGSPIILPDDIADAILFVWYPGERGGRAVAEVLFGEISPSGKLPITFPKSEGQLPLFEDYSMQNRTYRFLREEPKYYFGHGLSYTNFTFSEFEYNLHGTDLTGEFTFTNNGNFDAEEVCFIFLMAKHNSTGILRRQMVWFKRIFLAKHTEMKVDVKCNLDEFSYLLDGTYSVEFGVRDFGNSIGKT